MSVASTVGHSYKRTARLLIWTVVCLISRSPVVATQQWIVRIDFWGVPAFFTLDLERDGTSLVGSIDGEPVSGVQLPNHRLTLDTQTNGRPTTLEAQVSSNRMIGVATYPAVGSQQEERHSFTGRLVPSRSANGPQVHQHVPKSYSNTFDPDREPVLTLWPGDTVSTKTIDSGGVDENGQTQALFGNPQTGPFFVVGAEPGDTLVVHLDRLQLNRDYADSLDAIARRVAPTSVATRSNRLGARVRWNLDLEDGTARPADASGALSDFEVPLKPMLGGLAVAPAFGWPALSTGDTGPFGGNMDFPEVVEGTTVYLPVYRPGALLYLGDAHAAQGDGETTEFALETSMAVTLTVDLIKGHSINAPRVVSSTQIMSLGQAGTLEDALKIASGVLFAWLETDYGLTLSEVAQVVGTSIEYRIVNIAGRNVGVAALLPKDLLPPSRNLLTRPPRQ